MSEPSYVCSGCGETVPGPRPLRQYCAWTKRAETMTPAVNLERTTDGGEHADA